MSQVLKLGLTGAETTLSEESRVFSAFGNEGISITGRSANATKHTDFVARKRSYTITYTQPKETLKDQIEGFYDLQISSGSFLSFIYTDKDDAEIQTDVEMSAPNFGQLIPKDDYYYGSVSIELVEV